MATTQTKAVAKPAPAPSSVPAIAPGAIPPFFAEALDMGTDSITSEDVVIPRIKICQPSSAAIKAAIKDIKDGEFYDPLNRVILGGMIEFFVMLMYKSRVWFSEEFKLLASEYIDPITRQTYAYGNDTKVITDNYDAGKDSYNYFVVLKEDLLKAVQLRSLPKFYLISMMSASIAGAKQLNSKIIFNRQEGIPIWCQLVQASTRIKTFKKGAAHLPEFQYPELLTDEVGFHTLKKFYPIVKAFVSKAEQQRQVDDDAVEPQAHAKTEAAAATETDPF